MADGIRMTGSILVVEAALRSLPFRTSGLVIRLSEQGRTGTDSRQSVNGVRRCPQSDSEQTGALPTATGSEHDSVWLASKKQRHCQW